jgi:transcriptional regulator with XRE-family HTH domain
MKQTKNDCDQEKSFNTGVNERIKQVRIALGLSQANFCRDIFLTSGHYAELELGNRRVNARIIKLIGVIYGVNEHFLKTGEGKKISSVRIMLKIVAQTINRIVFFRLSFMPGSMIFAGYKE